MLSFGASNKEAKIKEGKMLLSLGAINKQSRQYVYPKIALKTERYVCPECDKDLILCQGAIRVYHFRHKVDTVNPCHHYDRPSETQIHKDAKLVLKTMLEQHVPLSFFRTCIQCKKVKEHKTVPVTETSTIRLQHRFTHENQMGVADVAHLDQDSIVCLFEICNTQKTKEGERHPRPEPWYEIDAKTLIQKANEHDRTDGPVIVPCIREIQCKDCFAASVKPDNLEKYVRLKLGQTVFSRDDTPVHGSDHLRFVGGVDEYGDLDGLKHNRQIIDIFKKDFGNNYRVVLHSRKGYIKACVVINDVYHKYDYWGAGYNCVDEQYPCRTVFEISPGGTEGTVGILVRLIRYCNALNESNEQTVSQLKRHIIRCYQRSKMCKENDEDDEADEWIKTKDIAYRELTLVQGHVAYGWNNNYPVTRWSRNETNDNYMLSSRCATIDEEYIVTIEHLVTHTVLQYDLELKKVFYKNEWRNIVMNKASDQVVIWYNSTDDTWLDRMTSYRPKNRGYHYNYRQLLAEINSNTTT